MIQVYNVDYRCTKLSGAEISVCDNGYEIFRVANKFNKYFNKFNETRNYKYAEVILRENAKWIADMLCYLRQLEVSDTIYHKKQIDNIWRDYNFGQLNKEFINSEWIHKDYFDEDKVLEEIPRHLVKLDDEYNDAFERIALCEYELNDKIKAEINRYVKEEGFKLGDYMKWEDEYERAVYHVANSLAHNNFRLNKYINVFFTFMFYSELMITLKEMIEELVDRYNSYVKKAVNRNNKRYKNEAKIEFFKEEDLI